MNPTQKNTAGSLPIANTVGLLMSVSGAALLQSILENAGKLNAASVTVR